MARDGVGCAGCGALSLHLTQNFLSHLAVPDDLQETSCCGLNPGLLNCLIAVVAESLSLRQQVTWKAC